MERKVAFEIKKLDNLISRKICQNLKDGNLSNISHLQINILKYLYLNNNSFKSINSLKDFKNLNEADLMCNLNLENLDGLENNQNLIFLCAQFCNLKNIIGVKGSKNLKTASFKFNSNLETLSGLENTSTSICFPKVHN